MQQVHILHGSLELSFCCACRLCPMPFSVSCWVRGCMAYTLGGMAQDERLRECFSFLFMMSVCWAVKHELITNLNKVEKRYILSGDEARLFS
jgi:hypothetical protein